MGSPGTLVQLAEVPVEFPQFRLQELKELKELPNPIAISAMDEQRKLLFICTGNYYRSRYAELYFNARSDTLAAGWSAESRGFRLSSANVGPIAPCVLERLTARAVLHLPASRFPLQLHEHDLVGASRIIALDEDEHRPLARALFPLWSDRIAYWRIPDLDRLGSEAALNAIEHEVERLIKTLLQL